MNILVIEDDTKLNESLCTLLSKKGYTPVPAKSEQEAEGALKQHAGAIAIALVDMFLPVKSGNPDDKESGLRLIQLMTTRYQSIVKVVFTGHGDLESADKCMQAGAFSYCIKSDKPDDLLERIKQAEVKYRREQSLREGFRGLREEVEEVQKRLTNLIGAIERLSDEADEVSGDDRQATA
jgi:DNA-binding NtrC family response regulator